MTSLVSVACAEGAWTLVATSVNSGSVQLQGTIQNPVVAYCTFSNVGAPAPTLKPNASGSLAFLLHNQSTTISDTGPIDIYIYPPQGATNVLVSAN